MRKRIQAGFTLIELLVVIAIIAILAALLLSALSRGKAEAQSAQCKSNLHQLGSSLRMYLNDDAGTYPYLMYFPANNAKSAFCWFDALIVNIPNGTWGSGVLSCPGYQWEIDPGGFADVFDNVSVVPGGPYCYNGMGWNGNLSGGLGGIRPGTLPAGNPPVDPVRENDVVAPAELYALGDAPVNTWIGPEIQGLPTVTNTIGWFDYGPFIGGGQIVKIQHAYWLNMLFADGHVAGVKTNVLFATNAIYVSKWNHDNMP